MHLRFNAISNNRYKLKSNITMKNALTLTFLVLNFIVVKTQDYPIFQAAQLKGCEHLLEDQISACTDSLFYNEMLRAIDITACRIQDSSFTYNFTFSIDQKGKVSNATVTFWGEETFGSVCKKYFEKKCQDIAKEMQFIPAKDQNGNDLESEKYFKLTYPRRDPRDTIMAINDKYKVIEQMPRFTGCEYIVGNPYDKQRCADGKLLQYVYENLKYPKSARENGAQGKVFVQFVVERSGKINEAKIVRDIGAGCGDAVLDLVNKMNDLEQPFVPGIQYGQPVRVLYTIPVSFALETKKKKK